MKVLMLGFHDSKLAGHIQYDYLNMPDKIETCMITLVGRYGKQNHNFHQQFKSVYGGRLQATLELVFKWVYSILFFRCLPVVDRNHKEFAFFDFEYYPISAKRILKKCPQGFIPDVISVHWDRGFANSRVIRELYKLTGAKIVYHFIDEAPMTGGCHYPVDCNNYLNGCKNCPALKFGKKLAEKQIETKKKNLSGLPIMLCGTPYDMRLAGKSPIFKNYIKIPIVQKPKVSKVSREEARKCFGLDDNSFVVFLGASSLSDPRKGAIYSINALERASSIIPNLVVLAAGSSDLSINGVEVKNLGFVSVEVLVNCFCAADCFLSTTIADSGPMMVNYSIALGTPVVSFSIGIAEDLVVHKHSGYLAEYKNVDDIVNGLSFFYSLDEKEKNAISNECVRIMDDKSIKGTWIDLVLAYGYTE